MIGKVLQGRYQIVQSLGAGVFGQTYIAVDINHPEHPKCVVKQLKVTSSQPSHLDTLRLRFLTETQTLKQLGHHNQIPQLIACFEEHERFYLVQEFIEGHALAAELPLNKAFGYFWSESEVVTFLINVLEILEFVHSQGVIHCDVKPENLIRRSYDGKLVLIDFGSIQPVDLSVDSVLPIYRIPVTSLGYIPPEQFIGQTQLNSDIYALGMMAIQALTGLTPLQLRIDPQSNETTWRTSETPVGDYLAAVVSKMIRYNHKDRFQTVTDVLQVLRQMPIENDFHTLEVEYSVLEETGNWHSQLDRPSTKKESPLLTGVRVGLLANSLVMGVGVYSLLNNTPAYSETEALQQATKEYQSGDLDGAIALAKSIPTSSNVYPEAQATIEEWQQQWQVAAEQYLVAETAVQQGRWSDVLRVAPQVPDNLYWKSKTARLVEHAKAKVGIESKGLLAKAYEKAAAKDFNTALHYLNQIPKGTATDKVVDLKIAEYDQKRQVRAAYLLQEAYKKATNREFETAVQFLRQINKDTSVYAIAQAKLIEYTQKQRIIASSQEVAISVTDANSTKTNDTTAATKSSGNTESSFIRSDSSTKLKDLQPGNLFMEVNIR
jgi:serine/threonine protein kinase